MVNMPSWKGWDEGEVRGHSTPLPDQLDAFPYVVAFTAINALSNSTSGALTGSHASHCGMPTGPAGEQSNRGPARSLVSDYLGRGDDKGIDAPVKLASAPAHGSRRKKIAGKGQKRAANSIAQTQAKRRKKSDISDGMPVSKPANHTAAKKVIMLEGQATHDRKSPAPAAVPTFSNHNKANAPKQSKSAFVLPTSMDSIHRASQPTLFENARSHTGKRTTVYELQSNIMGKTLGTGAQVVGFRRPQTSTMASPLVVPLTPKEPQATPIPASTICGEAVNNTYLPLTPPQSSRGGGLDQSSGKQPVQLQHRSSGPVLNVNDGLIADDGDDDDDDTLGDILDFVDQIEAKESRNRTPKVSQQNTILNASVHSRRHTLLLTPEEELLPLADPDEDHASVSSGVEGPLPRSCAPSGGRI